MNIVRSYLAAWERSLRGLRGIADTNGVTGIDSSATYRWPRFATDGTTLEVASLGTGSTYTLTEADAMKRIRCSSLH